MEGVKNMQAEGTVGVPSMTNTRLRETACIGSMPDDTASVLGAPNMQLQEAATSESFARTRQELEETAGIGSMPDETVRKRSIPSTRLQEAAGIENMPTIEESDAALPEEPVGIIGSMPSTVPEEMVDVLSLPSICDQLKEAASVKSMPKIEEKDASSSDPARHPCGGEWRHADTSASRGKFLKALGFLKIARCVAFGSLAKSKSQVRVKKAWLLFAISRCTCRFSRIIWLKHFVHIIGNFVGS